VWRQSAPYDRALAADETSERGGAHLEIQGGGSRAHSRQRIECGEQQNGRRGIAVERAIEELQKLPGGTRSALVPHQHRAGCGSSVAASAVTSALQGSSIPPFFRQVNLAAAFQSSSMAGDLSKMAEKFGDCRKSISGRRVRRALRELTNFRRMPGCGIPGSSGTETTRRPPFYLLAADNFPWSPNRRLDQHVGKQLRMSARGVGSLNRTTKSTASSAATILPVHPRRSPAANRPSPSARSRHDSIPPQNVAQRASFLQRANGPGCTRSKHPFVNTTRREPRLARLTSAINSSCETTRPSVSTRRHHINTKF